VLQELGAGSTPTYRKPPARVAVCSVLFVLQEFSVGNDSDFPALGAGDDTADKRQLGQAGGADAPGATGLGGALTPAPAGAGGRNASAGLDRWVGKLGPWQREVKDSQTQRVLCGPVVPLICRCLYVDTHHPPVHVLSACISSMRI
jgi:hypothetical protein